MTRAEICMLILVVIIIFLITRLFVIKKKDSVKVYEFVPWGVHFYYFRVIGKKYFFLNAKGKGEIKIVNQATGHVIKQWNDNTKTCFSLTNGLYYISIDGNFFARLQTKHEDHL